MNMHIVSTNFVKTLAWKHEYDVKLRRHTQRTPNTNDHHKPLNETQGRNEVRWRRGKKQVWLPCGRTGAPMVEVWRPHSGT